MKKYTIAVILLVSLLLIRFIFNGLAFLEVFNLRVLLYLLLFAVAIVGIVFSKRWSYLLSSWVAVSEFSIISISTTGISLELGALVIDTLILAFSVWGFYRFEKVKTKQRR